VLPVLPVPRHLEPAIRLNKRVVGLGGALTGTMKRLPQLGDLGRSSTLNAGIDLPGITASRRDEFSEIYML